MKHVKRRLGGEGAVFYILTVIICASIIVLINLIFRPDVSRGNEEDTAVVTHDTSGISADTAEPETEPPESDTDSRPAATSSLPETSMKEIPVTDPPVSYIPSTEYNPPQGRNTDFTGSLFIGDSRTEGLMLYSGVYGATGYTARGLMVDTYFTTPAVNLNGRKVSVADAVAENPNFDRVFIMLGINELGWVYDSVFRDGYAKLIDHVKGTVPGAQIYVQSIIPVTASKSASDNIYNNENILRYNELIRSLCAEKGVIYVDLVPYLCGENYALPEDAAFDGIHLKKPYCQRWLDCLSENMG